MPDKAIITATDELFLRELQKINDSLEKMVQEMILSRKSTREYAEQVAEMRLAEEDPETPAEKSLFETREGKYSYKVYAENKRLYEERLKGEGYIDDFEKAADETDKKERISKYG